MAAVPGNDAQMNSNRRKRISLMNDSLIADLIFPAIRNSLHARFHHAFRSQLFYA